jgi:hypothetical protein
MASGFKKVSMNFVKPHKVGESMSDRSSWNPTNCYRPSLHSSELRAAANSNSAKAAEFCFSACGARKHSFVLAVSHRYT